MAKIKVNANGITDGTITATNIADGTITSGKILDGTIANADISSTAGITLNKLSGNPNFRNIVINGDMQIAQRSTSVASITTDAYHTVDRFLTTINSLGTWTQSQSTDVPSGYGFTKSFKMDCTTADASPSAGDYLFIRQIFEGQNLQYLKKGTANAVSLTASFWVKSTKTGTHIVQLLDADNNRSVSKSYTINVSNTWEFKTLTFPPDTTGAFDNDNAGSLQLRFWLGAGTTYTSGTLNTTWESGVSANTAVGQVNIADSTANDWLITGVQLEAGTSATDFEFLPIDVSLDRCLRYYEQLGVASFAKANDSTSYWTSFNFRKRKRANPTASLLTTSFSIAEWGVATSTTTSGTIAASYLTNNDAVYVRLGGFTGLTAGATGTPAGANGVANSTDPIISFNSEL